MNDDRFEELMRDAAHTYRTPPQAQLDEMWSAIESASFRGDAIASTGSAVEAAAATRRPLVTARWLAIAATLVIGVAVGRVTARLGGSQAGIAPVTPVATTRVASAAAGSAGGSETFDGDSPYDVETSKYLGQTAALLIALPTEARGGHPDEQFIARAGELLSRTRLLMDSPASSDPQMHALLDDLELVLAQIVRLQDSRSRTEIDLINHALEQRDVLPRLRSAAADISAN